MLRSSLGMGGGAASLGWSGGAPSPSVSLTSLVGGALVPPCHDLAFVSSLSPPALGLGLGQWQEDHLGLLLPLATEEQQQQQHLHSGASLGLSSSAGFAQLLDAFLEGEAAAPLVLALPLGDVALVDAGTGTTRSALAPQEPQTPPPPPPSRPRASKDAREGEGGKEEAEPEPEPEPLVVTRRASSSGAALPAKTRSRRRAVTKGELGFCALRECVDIGGFETDNPEGGCRSFHKHFLRDLREKIEPSVRACMQAAPLSLQEALWLGVAACLVKGEQPWRTVARADSQEKCDPYRFCSQSYAWVKRSDLGRRLFFSVAGTKTRPTTAGLAEFPAASEILAALFDRSKKELQGTLLPLLQEIEGLPRATLAGTTVPTEGLVQLAGREGSGRKQVIRVCLNTGAIQQALQDALARSRPQQKPLPRLDVATTAAPKRCIDEVVTSPSTSFEQQTSSPRKRHKSFDNDQLGVVSAAQCEAVLPDHLVLSGSFGLGDDPFGFAPIGSDSHPTGEEEQSAAELDALLTEFRGISNSTTGFDDALLLQSGGM